MNSSPVSLVILGTAALTLPSALVAATTDTVDSSSYGTFTLINHGEVGADAQFYFLNGNGPDETVIEKMDAQTDRVAYSVTGLSSFESGTSWQETLPATDVSGTLYGFDLNYTTGACRIGTFSLEFGYRSGELESESGVKRYGGRGTYGTGADVKEWNISGDNSRRMNLDEKSFSVLALWRPKNIGEWLGVGIEYAHQNHDFDYNYELTLDADIGGYTYSYNSLEFILSGGLKTDDILLHVRLGGQPFASFIGGRVKVSAIADLAGGYSSRNTDTVTGWLWLNGKLMTKANTNLDDFADDTWLFKGGASLVLSYDVLGGTLVTRGGVACESDIGKDRAGETKGLTAAIGYRMAW